VATAYRTHQSPPETERLFLKSPQRAVLYQPRHPTRAHRDRLTFIRL
jgi:hypothetical protein